MSENRLRTALLAGASLGAMLAAPQAFAQPQAGPAPASTTGLTEVVVTATRQSASVNRVALSIAAVTQQGLDRQGIKDAQDLARVVPGLTIPPGGAGGQSAGTNGVGIFTIRGIYASAGAATTGVYLNDTSITRRNNAGVVQNNGAPLPIVYDLDRVEVLKGPQGTLYGGSSEGGTVRFITPAPSLTTMSGSIRGEAKTIDMGGWGGEFGAAIGGPLVKDKLGFRLSGLFRRNPGYIDAYSPYTGQKMFSDVNQEDQNMVRGALKWQATDRFSVDASVYSSVDRTRSQVIAPSTIFSKSANGQKASASETFTTPSVCIDQRSAASYVPYNPGQPLNSQASANPFAPVGCNTPIVGAGPPAGAGFGGVAGAPASGGYGPTPANQQFQRPSYTYGPFKQGPDIAYLTGQQELSPRTTLLQVVDLTLNYDFDKVNVKSITSYLHDSTYSENNGGEDQTQRQVIVGGPGYNPAGTAANGNQPTGVVGFPLWGGFPDYPGHFVGISGRDGIEQEIRVSSRDPADRLQWVAGLYFEHHKLTNLYRYPDDHFNQSLQSFWGPSSNVERRYGVSEWDGNSATTLNAHLIDTNLAVYGEANYYLTSKLKLTAGVRVSSLNFQFDSFDAGPFSSRYPDSFGGSSKGQEKDTPVTPKFGVSYEFTKNDLVYFTAAKGFRSGGVNAPVGPVVCAPGLALYGISATDAPLTYGPDEVWSYEVGGKFRVLDNRMQLNMAAFRVDWSNIQSAITLTCGQGFVENGKGARSQGFDFQGQWRPIDPLTLSLNVGYDEAKYIDPVAGPRGPGIGPNAVNGGDPFPVPPWQVSASAAYDTMLLGKYDTYLQLDYQWSSSYRAPGSFGVASWNPYVLNVTSVDNVSGRLGTRFKNWDLNVFANNLLNRQEKVGNAGVGITQCIATNLACTATSNNGGSAFNSFNPFVNQLYTRPREVGIQANYRF
jgi:outer membrane receptor protein involved in Fe transport